jgi:hypothetical protein
MKFGVLKSKMLNKLTESYSKENKKEIKDILNLIGENKSFKEMYLLYEEFETKYFEDKETAKYYVDELSSALKNKASEIENTSVRINEAIGKVETETNPTYDMLDLLSENDTLLNIDKKVIAKKQLVDFLIAKKDINESAPTVYSKNENLLLAVLSNNFNVLYNNSMNESQKEEFKNIMSLSNEDLKTKTLELQETILTKVGSMLNESNENEMIEKLNAVKKEVSNIIPTKYSYYKLIQLKNGLD